jgi:putative PIG3 family NAD(P)H quinone oxidoreductase
MKAIVVEQKEGQPQLIWQDVPDITYQSHEVLVRVQATAVNRADLMQAKGGYPPPPGASDILGLEMAGVIAAVGADVTGWQVGQRVCALLPGGGYAQYAAVPAGMLMLLPDNWSFEMGAAVPEVWLTAYVNLFGEAHLQDGETVLIHAGASGVGTAAIQLAKAAGAQVLVTAGSEAKTAACVALGANKAILYKSEDFLTIAQQFTNGRGVDVILDPVGANYLEKNIQLLAPHGRLVVISVLSGAIAPLNLGLVLRKRLKIVGSTLRNRPVAEKIALTQAFYGRFGSLLAQGVLKPIIDTTFPITQAQQAHEYVAQDKNIGKVVLVVE